MRCLYCGINFEDTAKLKSHYFSYHRINSDNYFLKRLFEKNNTFSIKKCYRCDEILLNGSYEKKHNFLKRYQEGGSRPTELKPINKTILDRNFQKFSINFDEHSNSYDFANGMGLAEEFVNVFDKNFNSFGDKKLVLTCSFIIVNYQSPVEDGLPIYDSRFWSTKTYEGFYFNDFIKTSLIYDIRKRIIINGATGSSSKFNRFQSLSISVNATENQGILR